MRIQLTDDDARDLANGESITTLAEDGVEVSIHPPTDEDDERSQRIADAGADVTDALVALYIACDNDEAAVGECLAPIEQSARIRADFETHDPHFPEFRELHVRLMQVSDHAPPLGAEPKFEWINDLTNLSGAFVKLKDLASPELQVEIEADRKRIRALLGLDFPA